MRWRILPDLAEQLFIVGHALGTRYRWGWRTAKVPYLLDRLVERKHCQIWLNKITKWHFDTQKELVVLPFSHSMAVDRAEVCSLRVQVNTLRALAEVCLEFRHLSSDDRLWRPLVEEEFGLADACPAGTSMKAFFQKRYGPRVPMPHPENRYRSKVPMLLLRSGVVPGYPWLVLNSVALTDAPQAEVGCCFHAKLWHAWKLWVIPCM